MNLVHVERTVREKMRLEAPVLFSRLQATGRLEAVVSEMSEDIKDQAVHAGIEAGTDPALQTAQEHRARVQAMEDAARRTLETLLSELEFPGEEPTTTD